MSPHCIDVDGYDEDTDHDRPIVAADLKDSQELFRLAVESCPSGMVMSDRTDKIILVNSAIEQMFGYPRGELIGKQFDVLLPKALPSLVFRRSSKFLARGTVETCRDLVGRRKDVSEFPVEVTFNPIHAGDGFSILSVIVDISDRRNAETHLAQMEGRYRGLLEAAPDAMVVVNQSGEIVLLNVQAEKQFGYSRDELVGQKVTNIIPEGFAERLIADGSRPAADALAQQIGTGIELSGLRKDESEFPIEIMLSPLDSTEGILVTAAIRDISVRKAADRHLAQMEGRYRGLLEAAPDAMVVVNQRGEIVLLNVQAEKQFGYCRDELVGQKVTNIIPEGFAERLIADALRSPEDAQAQQIGTGIELNGRRNDGSDFPIEIMLSPLNSSEGILVTAAIRDITTRRGMERLKDEFVATVSHELRTPLTSIAGALGLLIGNTASSLPDSAVRLIAIAHANSERLVRLINDILDIEKIESAHMVLNLRPIDVQSLVEQAIEANRGFAEGYGVRIRLNDAPNTCIVRSDSDRLMQVVTNLLSNAIKFSPKGDEVTVAIKRRGGTVRISVRDHGPGIPVDFKPHVFRKFAQADATDARQKSGTGLGLSIVKQIVTRLGGEVAFDDASGGGTLFHVELPSWSEALPREVPERPLILHVDDDLDTLQFVALAFGSSCDLVSVASIEEARRAIEVNHFNMALLDLALGSDSGLELLVALRSADDIAIPVIIYSAHGANQICDAQIQAALSKSQTPIDILLRTVLGHLSRPTLGAKAASHLPQR
jgi:PAS domain S-box-containing protein